MDYGNPCLYGPSHWYAEQFDVEDVAFIPSMRNKHTGAHYIRHFPF
ncbi:MAG: hypothetical protein JRD04_05340 [Deltaproteobacteria bacterium]|nr:hypothetical protein [Deltaproteobacteria bacterium]